MFAMCQKHPLVCLFLFVVAFIVVIPSLLWGVIQLYDVLCGWCGCCDAPAP